MLSDDLCYNRSALQQMTSRFCRPKDGAPTIKDFDEYVYPSSPRIDLRPRHPAFRRQPFQRCRFVDERVIVPRSFIYELLGDSLTPWIEHPELVHRALDLCTGSGCLAVQMAHHYPAAEIDAVDLSLDALEVAAINVEDYGLEERINLIHTDLFEGLEGTYDLIVSNPPYVDAESVDMLPDEYLHEPELALGSGEDGLDATRQILLHAAKYLNPKGVLLVEIGHNRDVLEAAYPELPFTWLETSGGDGFVFLLTREQLLGEY